MSFICIPTDFERDNLCYSDLMGITDDPDFIIDRNSFDNFIIMYVKQGILFHEQNNNLFEVHPGQSILVNLKIPHKYYFKPEIKSEILWIHMNGHDVQNVADRINDASPLPFMYNLPDMQDEIYECFNLYQGESADHFALSAKIYTILMRIYRLAQNENLKSQYGGEAAVFRENIQNIISKNILSKIDLQFFADSLNMSKYHFAHLFKKYYNISPMKYIMNEKIKLAKHYLIYTADKITLISDKLQFTSLSHFSNAFKKETGISPEQFRKLSWSASGSPENHIINIKKDD